MGSGGQVRVAVAVRRDAMEPWHRRCLERIRAVEGVGRDVVIGAPSELRDPASVDVVIDLANVDQWPAHPGCGVWQFRFGDGAPVANGAAGTLARLYKLTPDRDRAVVLHEGWFRAQTAEAPGTRSVLDRVAPWCGRALLQLAAGDEDALSALPQPTAGCRDTRPPLRVSGWREEAIGVLERWARRERWSVGLLPVGIAEILERGTLTEPRWIVGQPRELCYADPFPLRRADGRLEVLAEAYRYSGGPGSIVQLAIDADARVLDTRTRIAGERHHASYPFVVHRGPRAFCIPETARLGRVSAYACDDGDGAWRIERDLLAGFPAVDPTIVEHDGRWWLFCTHREEENQTELHLFSAPDWAGPWMPHRLKPVKADARSSRPAGTPFIVDGVLYRPAQDCSRRYGGAIAINRIVELSDWRFREETVLTLGPAPGSAWPDGVHTINSLDGVTVVDGLRVEKRGRDSFSRP